MINRSESPIESNQMPRQETLGEVVKEIGAAQANLETKRKELDISLANIDQFDRSEPIVGIHADTKEPVRKELFPFFQEIRRLQAKKEALALELAHKEALEMGSKR